MEPTLDYITASQTLHISPSLIKDKITKEDKINLIKKSYYKLALKHHPDKGGDPQRFNEIKEAYDFIIHVEKTGTNGISSSAFNSSFMSSDHDTFENMFVSFVETMIKNRTGYEHFDNLFIKTTLQTILKKCDAYSLKVFAQLNIEKCRLIYSFLSQHKDSFCLSDEQLVKYKEVIQNKIKNNNIILLNPSMNDILNDNIYKLDIGEDTHYIPLWHDEILVDNMIIKNIPDISDNIVISANHDITIKFSASIIELYKKGNITVPLTDKTLDIQADQVTLTKDPQFIVFKDEGKLIPNKQNLYDNNKRSNIIVEFTLLL